jgi:hypothetical protein
MWRATSKCARLKSYGGSLGFSAMKSHDRAGFSPAIGFGEWCCAIEGGVFARARIEALCRRACCRACSGAEITLRGAQISLRRAKDGTVALAFHQDSAAIGAADGFRTLLDQIDQGFDEGA